MKNTVIIGQTFLVRDWKNRNYHSNLVFYGSSRCGDDTWKVNIGKEIGDYSGIIEESISGTFCIDVQVGNELRFHDYYIYIKKNGDVGFRSDYITESQKGRRSVVSIKIIDIGKDFMTIEYRVT